MATRAWFTVATKPRQEDLVCRIYEISEINYFFPRIRVSSDPSVPDSKAIRPLFPGYLFVNVEPNSREWDKVSYSMGVRSIVSFGGVPAMVPEDVIQSIRLKTVRTGVIDPMLSFNEGDSVVVKDGPFKGLSAIFKGYISDSGRVKILMDVLRTATQVELWAHQITKVVGE